MEVSAVYRQKYGGNHTPVLGIKFKLSHFNIVKCTMEWNNKNVKRI